MRNTLGKLLAGIFATVCAFIPKRLPLVAPWACRFPEGFFIYFNKGESDVFASLPYGPFRELSTFTPKPLMETLGICV
jgi:hypothetical protein